MKRFSHLVFAAVGVASGWCAAMAMHGGKTPASPAMAREQGAIAYYQSPMHPWIKSAFPGKCTVCGMDLVPIYRGSTGMEKLAADAVLLPSESIRASGIQTATAKRAPLQRTLRVTGKFEEDASWHAIISAPVEGRIDGLGLVHGNGKVTQRQPLATIFSRTLLAAANEYKQALNQNEAAVAAAQRKLEQDGLVWEQIKTIPLRQENDLYFGILSPRTGTVVKSYVSEGQYVRQGQKLFEITDLSKLWFMFPAYAQDLSLLEVGQIVEIAPTALPGEKFKALISFIGQTQDEMTHAVHVRVDVDNPKGRLQLDGDATGVVHLQAPEVLTVPRTAVLWPGDAPRVYVEKEAGIYEPRIVQLGRAGDADWEVLAGLNEGERIVTSGGMLIDGQAQLDAPAPLAPQ